ncbi:MAG: ATP synthase F0 subunit B [Acidobacteria bacterium]|nr:ATP synthase F0 subunit B [Acidobacteriota bacterium]
MKRKHRIWNLAATLIALLVLITAAGKVKAYLLQTETPATSSSGHAAHSAEQTGAEGEPHAAEGHEEGGIKSAIYKWINLLLIVGAFWYLSKKYLGPFLRGRGEAIREDMQLSREALKTATERLSVVEQKLEKIDEEIGAMRNSALQEAAAERTRIEDMGKADAAKISQRAEQEIAAAAKLARQELKKYASELAVELAEKRIQQSMSVESDRVIFRSFIEDMADGHADGHKPKGGA